MMRPLLPLLGLWLLLWAPVVAQQTPGNRQTPGNTSGRPLSAGARAADDEPAAQRPFPPLNAQEQQRLRQLLAAWEAQSQGTKTLECRFQRWSYAPGAAPANVPKDTSTGVIKYAAPDKGLFKVEEKVFFAGMNDEGKPTYAPQPGQYGEWWVCNGEELMEFNRGREECRIQTLPPEMRGQQIFNSPLPFVFNLDAAQIQQRYWVRQVASPKPGVLLIEAWPKMQEDRAQYRLVQVALDESSLLPTALVMYAPNFDVSKNPEWDHYEFTDCVRNGTGQRLQNFLKHFIGMRPPASWKVLRNHYVPPPSERRTAEAPEGPTRR